MQQKKKPKNYAGNKRAFDSVFAHYRALATSQSISAVNMAAASGGSRNPAKPTPLDFRCDVDKAIDIVVPKNRRVRFRLTYIVPWAETDLEQEIFADKMLGGIRHSFEQRLGELFTKRGLYPVQKKGYFYSVRGKKSK